MKRYLWKTLVVSVIGIAVIAFQMQLKAPMLVSAEGRVGAEITETNRQVMLNIELDDFYFKPDKIEWKYGKKTTLVLENEGDVKHTFTVSDLDIDIVLNPGEKKEVIVIPDKTGTFKLICRFHPEMVGVVTVKK